MKTWIALLRGINVGGKHIVPMKELVKLLEANGFTGVKTYIQSGNVVLQSRKDPQEDISRLIDEQFGFRPEVFTMSAAELQDALDQNPYQTDIGKSVHFFFLDRVPTTVDYELMESFRAGSEAYELKEKVFYLYAPDGIGRSKLVEKIGKAFPKVMMTARNLNTIRKLIEMSV